MVVFSSIGVLGGLTLGVALVMYGCYKRIHSSKSHFYSSNQVAQNNLPPPPSQPEPVPIYEDMTEMNNSMNVAYGTTANPDPDPYYY